MLLVGALMHEYRKVFEIIQTGSGAPPPQTMGTSGLFSRL
jgi:hypothetical protein